VSVRARALLSLALFVAAEAAAADPPAGTPSLGRPLPGGLVTIDRTWRETSPLPESAPSEASWGLELCLTIENRWSETAYDAAVWLELYGGSGSQMRRLGLQRTPLDPSTLGPGESGEACFGTPPDARGVFVRLRARWPATPSGADARAPAPPRSSGTR
jgi:hypothetical protein